MYPEHFAKALLGVRGNRRKVELLQMILDSMSQGIRLFDKDLKLVFFNQKFNDLRGYPPGFIRRGMSYEEIARFNAERGDYGRGDLEELVRRTVRSHQRGERFRGKRVMPDGRVLAVNRDFLPDGGQLTIYTDITQLKMSEKMLRNRNRELETLYRMSEITGAARSLNVALSQIVEQISLDTGFPIVTIEIYDDKRDMMILSGETGEPPLSGKTPVEAPMEEALSGLVVRTDRPVLESETSSGPLHTNEKIPRPQIQTFVGVPMMSDGHVLGALCLANTEAMQVDDGRLKWLQSLANSVASLIERKWAKQMLREPSSYRKQLRRRLLKDGGGSMGDRALLELVLQPIRPNANVKTLAKDLIAQFGGFAEVITANPKRLIEVKGIGENAVVALKSVQAAAVRLTREQVLNRPLLSSWRKLLDYCRASMAHAEKEELRVLFLDRRNVLIADEVQQTGTIDHTPVYPREVIKRALDHGASGIVLAHNHPSGDPTPSQGDIEMTHEVRDAGEKLGITLHDHLVIGKRGHASFKKLGLL